MRHPAAFKPLYVLGEKHPNEPMLLTFDPERGFFEPVTNGAAEPVIGSVLGWCYRSEGEAEDRAIFASLTAHGVNSPYIKPANCSVTKQASFTDLEISLEDPVELVAEDGSRRWVGP